MESPTNKNASHEKIRAMQSQGIRSSQFMLLIVMWMDSDGEKNRSYSLDYKIKRGLCQGYIAIGAAYDMYHILIIRFLEYVKILQLLFIYISAYQ